MKKAERRRAREAALQILYQWEIGGTDVQHAADTYFDLQWPDAAPAHPEVREFATQLAHETVRRIAEADALIADTAERWRPERMPVIDRLVLRLAAAELLGTHETPAPVIINEALELARTFSTEESVKFVNGMLDGMRKKIEPNQSPKPEARGPKPEPTCPPKKS